MEYRIVLLHLDDSPACAERTRVAISVAQTFDARLIGLYAVNPHLRPALDSSQVVSAYEAWRKQTLNEKRESAAAEFKKRVGRAGVRAEWRVAEGPVFTAFAMQARYADLIVVGQNDPQASIADAPADFPEFVCLSVGRPILVVPYAGSHSIVGDNVLVAWKGGCEAMRAVSDALPFLRRARSVHVVEVNRSEGLSERDEAPASGIGSYLALHGITAKTGREHADEADIGKVLLARATDLQCDLLVMGCYGHSRMKEIMLGGVSRTVLERMTLPVLMSH